MLYLDYMTDIFLSPETVVISPYEKCNAIYFIMKGTISINYNLFLYLYIKTNIG